MNEMVSKTASTEPVIEGQYLSRLVADWVVSMKYEDLPQNVVEAVTTFITDHVGVVLIGTTKESSKIIAGVAQQWGAKDGGCTLVGLKGKTSAPYAALVNGTTGHALELDDDHREGTQHSGVAVIPAAYATAELEGKSGRDLILAVALGYEIMIRLGEAHLGKSYLCGWHPTGTCGSIGAAIAAGKLLDLSAGQMVSAIGLGASQSSGLSTFRSNGAWNKRLHPGHAAQAGVLSAYLAKNNYRGPSESLLSPEGWLQAYAYKGEYNVDAISKKLGEKWDLLENSIKVHACCRFAAPIVDATLEAVNRENIKPEDVEEVSVGMAKFPLYRSLTEPQQRKYNPTSVVDAQFSLPFAAAVSIVKRRAFIDEYSETGIRDKDVLALAQRVHWFVDEEAERVWPTRYPAQVNIKLKNGRVVKSRIEWPKGDPENAVTNEELKEKYTNLASPVIGVAKANSSFAKLQRLADIQNVRELAAEITP